MALQRITNGVKYRLGRFFFNTLFPFWQSLGIHVTRNHYYQPIPDTRTLTDETFSKHSELPGLNMNEAGQLKLLEEVSARYGKECNALPLKKEETSKPYQYYVNNTFFESVDGEIYYGIVRRFKPSRIYEIGSGNSTYLSSQAVLKNREEDKNYNCELVAIEPYPNPVLQAGFPGLTRLVPKRVEQLPLAEFQKLKENDILFIDSSHIAKIGSDVVYEFLELLPRLNQGVIIHVHDIFIPSEYSRVAVLKHHIFFNEQYLLQAFLAFNDSFEVLWGGSYMHFRHPEKLEAAFRSYKRNQRWPGSFWMRKVR
jgi:hypothetical protein